MTWQELYEIARSLRQRADWLFDEDENQLASEGIWGALHYVGRALVECFGRSAGGSFNDGYIPGRSNSPRHQPTNPAMERGAPFTYPLL